MQTNDKQFYIYLRSTHERIPCTEKEFHAYYHDIDLFRQKQQYRKQCVCPQKKWLECDMDCQTCPFRRNDVFSLDKPLETAEGEEMSLLDSIPDESPLISEIIANKDLWDRLFCRLNEIMPQAIGTAELPHEPKKNRHSRISPNYADFFPRELNPLVRRPSGGFVFGGDFDLEITLPSACGRNTPPGP